MHKLNQMKLQPG